MTQSVFTRRYARFLQLLKKARVDAGLTQIEAAKKLRRPQSFLSKCESGERRVDIVELIAFCEVYDIDPATFVKHVADGV